MRARSIAAALLSMAASVGAPAEVRGQGACCQQDGCVNAASEQACGSAGGVLLPGKLCADQVCGTGACCTEFNCVLADAYNCISAGRTFGGAGTTCLDDPCEDNIGACCQDGACDLLSPVACKAEGGVWLGAGTNCVNDQCVSGACCVPGRCFDAPAYACAMAGGLFSSGAVCAPGVCDFPLECPADALLAQQRDPASFFGAYLSESSTQIMRLDNFNGVGGAISGVRYFGLDLRSLPGNVFLECTESDPTFDIIFYADDNGAPGPAVCTHTLAVTRTPTGILYQDFELNVYNVDLPAPCVLTAGWLSIVGRGDPQCLFYWVSSDDADQYSWCLGCSAPVIEDDMSFCLLGNAGGVFGACCDEATGLCQDGAEISDCLGTGIRFAPDTPCTRLDPPCEPVIGACCIGDGSCSEVGEAVCSAQDGNWLGPNTICSACPAIGACCFDVGLCTLETEDVCADAGFTWAGPGTTCGECPPLPECPDESLFAQNPEGPSAFLAGTSETFPGFRRWDDFSGVTGAVESLTWWGLDLAPAGGNEWAECIERDPTFKISFHTDAAGVPGAEVCSHTLSAGVTKTGILYFGTELNEYHVTLPEPCVLVDGWVGIVGLGDTQCWFLWMSSGIGDSYCQGCSPPPQDIDYSFCLVGTPGGVLGACCDTGPASCRDGVDIAACTGPEQRLEPGQACADLDPPCGVVEGACCMPVGTCALQQQDACKSAGGFWLGPDTLCAACPCIVGCPPGAIAEGEPICGPNYVDTYNGGCDAAVPAFSAISFCDKVCGVTGVYKSGGDLVPEDDWYEVMVDAPTQLEWTVEAEFPFLMAILDGNRGCESPATLSATLGDTCQTRTLSEPVTGGVYWLFVGPSAAVDKAACGAEYIAELTRGVSCLGDSDGDGDIDLDDYAALHACTTGPGGEAAPDCRRMDFDGDGDIDLHDTAALQAAFGAP